MAFAGDPPPDGGGGGARSPLDPRAQRRASQDLRNLHDLEVHNEAYAAAAAAPSIEHPTLAWYKPVVPPLDKNFGYLLPGHGDAEEAQRLAAGHGAVIADDAASAKDGSGDGDDSSSADSAFTAFVPEWGNGVRNWVRSRVLGNTYWEPFWLLVIMANCVTLAMEDPTDKHCGTKRCGFLKVADYIFTNLFVVEMGFKMVGLGLYARHDAYLRDSWSLMDGLIVVSGETAFFLDVMLNVTGPGLTGLRAFRLLRPLKAVQAFPSVRILIQSILASLPKLGDVFILYFFFLLVMGIVAVQQWKGGLRYHCVTQASLATGNESLYVTVGDGRMCTRSSNIHVGGHHCEWGSTCVEFGGNPEDGMLSFDNIGVSSLTLFVALTLEGWTDSMYYTMDATTYFAAFFWVILVIVGSFFILNLTIVIITEAFEMKQHEQKTSAFRAIDKDGGGELDRDEVRKMLKNANGGHPVEEAELDRMFSEMDTDGGGTVSLEEYLQYVSTHPGVVGAVLGGKGGGGAASFIRELKGLLFRTPLGQVKNAAEQVTSEIEGREGERSGFRHFLYQVCEPTGLDTELTTANWLFHTSILVAIMLNTIALGIEHHGQPQEMTDTLHILNFVFTVFFAAEALVKILALGVVGYFRDRFNCFDFLVSVLSLVGLFGLGGNVSVFRTFRALRVLRLAKQVPLLQRWIGILLASMKGAAVLTGLLALLVFIVALLGMQLFGGNFCHLEEGFDATAASLTAAERGKERGCGGVPRSHYDDLGTALMTTFQILTGEDWNKIMYNGMRASGNWVSVYFVLYYAVGNYTILNLFIAVLLSSRDLKDKSETDAESSVQELPASPTDDDLGGTEMAGSPGKDWNKLCSAQWPEDEPGSPVARPGAVLSRAGSQADRPKWMRRLPSVLVSWMENDRSLFFFGSENIIRKKMLFLFQQWWFESIVLLCIGVSTVTLALESPARPVDHPTERTLAQINFVMVWVFLLEMVVKIIGMGLILHPTSYLRNENWNILDFVIVCVSLLSLIVPGGGNIEFIKIMRTLRPLRFINKSEGMKVVVQALIRSITPLLNVLLISLLVWLIFGIMGVQIFSGKFYRCSLKEYGDMEDSLGIRLRTDCLNYTLCKDATTGEACRWQNYDSHFDHLPAAFLNLFEMASLEGWVDVMNLGIDSISHDEAPVRNNSPWMALYFLIFIVFGAFFIINMFIGVLIDTYYQEKEKACNPGGIFLNDRQRVWVDQHTKMLNMMAANRRERVRAADGSGGFLERLATSTYYDVFITSCIVLNVLVMATEHYPESLGWDSVLESVNLVFYGIFALEAVVKIVGLGAARYFRDPWNKFDITVVVLSTVGVVMQFVSKSPAVSVFRILRLARLLRMVKKAKGIKRILRTLLLSLPSMMNVAGILFLMFFIYAVLGVKLFARLQRGGPDNAMGPYANFENFAFSLLLLLRMTTGEAWQSVLKEARVSDPHHCDKQLGNCGHPIIATIYFCSFTLSGMYVLLNLFIAVILDAFSQSNDDSVCTDDYMDHVKECWDSLRINVPYEGFEAGGIPAHDLHTFLTAIGAPLGLPAEAEMEELEDFVSPMELEVDQTSGLILEVELIPKLFKMRYGQLLPAELQDRMVRKENAEIGATPLLPRTGTIGFSQLLAKRRNALIEESDQPAAADAAARARSCSVAERYHQLLTPRTPVAQPLTPAAVPHALEAKASGAAETSLAATATAPPQSHPSVAASSSSVSAPPSASTSAFTFAGLGKIPSAPAAGATARSAEDDSAAHHRYEQLRPSPLRAASSPTPTPTPDEARTPFAWTAGAAWPDGAQPRPRHCVRLAAAADGGPLGFGLDPQTGRVTRVNAGSPAEAAGLTVGLVVAGVNGQPAEGGTEASQAVAAAMASGDAVLEVEAADPTDMLVERYGATGDAAGSLDFLQLVALCRDLGLAEPPSYAAFEQLCAQKGRDAAERGFEWRDVHEMMASLGLPARNRVLKFLGLPVQQEQGGGGSEPVSSAAGSPHSPFLRRETPQHHHHHHHHHHHAALLSQPQPVVVERSSPLLSAAALQLQQQHYQQQQQQRQLLQRQELPVQKHHSSSPLLHHHHHHHHAPPPPNPLARYRGLDIQGHNSQQLHSPLLANGNANGRGGDLYAYHSPSQPQVPVPSPLQRQAQVARQSSAGGLSRFLANTTHPLS